MPVFVENLESQRILASVDQVLDRELLSQAFTTWGVEHEVVADNSIILSKLKEAASAGYPYTIVLLDMEIDTLDSAQIGALIREDKQITDVALILLASQEQKYDFKEIKEIGFNGFLSKPLHQSELYNTIQKAIEYRDINDSQRSITRYTASETERQKPLFKGRVLVVEDNITNQAVARGVLEKFGLYVDVAANGQEAIETLEHISYDLIFMDCQMPVMDGYTATQKIRDKNSRVLAPTTPVIAMTANAMRGDRERCLAAGMDDYVSKPLDHNHLRQVLKQWLTTVHDEPMLTENNQAQHEVTDNDLHAEATSGSHLMPVTSKPIFDCSAMRSQLMEDDELIHSVAESFLEDMPVQIEQLKSAALAKDVDKAAAQAHKIKGGSANIGALALSELAFQLEQAGRAGDLDKIIGSLSTLDQHFTQLRTEMERKLS